MWDVKHRNHHRQKYNESLSDEISYAVSVNQGLENAKAFHSANKKPNGDGISLAHARFIVVSVPPHGKQ